MTLAPMGGTECRDPLAALENPRCQLTRHSRDMSRTMVRNLELLTDLNIFRLKWDLWALGVHQDPLALLDPKVWRDPVVCPVTPALLDLQEPGESPELLDLLALRATLAAMVSLVLRDLLDLRDLEEALGCLVCPDVKATGVSVDFLESAESKDPLEKSVTLVPLALQDPPAPRELVVAPEREARMVLLVLTV